MAHELLAEFYNGGNWQERIGKIADGPMIDGPESMEALAMAGQMMPSYVSWAEKMDRKWKILAVELEFKIPWFTPAGREFDWYGFIDLVIQDILTGEIAVVDHKTTAQVLKSWRAGSDMSPQLPIYAAAVRYLGFGDVTHQIFNVITTYPYKTPQPHEKRFKRVTTFRPQAELDRIMLELSATVEEMHMDLYRRKALRDDCTGCPFHLPCNLNLKGIDARPVFIQQYKRREVEQESV